MLSESKTGIDELHHARQRLIVALDCPSQVIALNLVDILGDDVVFYKVGWRLFLQGGMALLEEIVNRGKDVFLDLKMDDIEETIESAVSEIGDRAMFLTIHGNGATARAALAGRRDKKFPKLLQVTLLSSIDQQDLKDLFGKGTLKLEEYVKFRAEKSIDSGCDGVIASGHTVRLLRKTLGPKPIIVTPGIRPASSAMDDHKRVLTPREALLAGADYLVVGRPIHAHVDPLSATRAILDEMESAIQEL